MNSHLKQKTSSKNSSSAKKLALFVVLAVLVLVFSAFSNHTNAAFKMDDKQKAEFVKIIRSDPAMNAQVKTQTDMDNLIALYESKYNNFDEVKNHLISDDIPDDPFAASLNLFSGKAVLQGFADSLSEIVLAVVIGVLSVIAAFCKGFVEFGAKVLDLTLSPNLYNFTNNPMVTQGWIVVRDICNLFFLLVLLFIAICTILKIEKYHAKKTLLMLIIMALLINFSKPIAIFIFDGSQLLMNFFLSQMGQVGTGKTSAVISKATQIAELVYETLPGYWGSNDTSLNIAVQYLFAVIFLFMLGTAFFVVALMLIIRIVVIMLLIIVSPFAFFAVIIPDFSKISSQWWSTLFEYSYYGPATAFFLLLATKLEDALPHLANFETGSQFTSKNFNTTIFNITHYLTVIVFLYASIFMAKKFGGGAGSAVVGNANRFMKWAGGMTKGGGMWGGAARVTGVADVYKGVKQGISKQPYWRALTKEGREAKRKETREKWEGRFAPFNISDARKKSEERKNDSDAIIEQDARRGDPAAILQAMSRGGSLAERLMTDPRVLQALDRYDDLRNASYKFLRDNGQHHLQVVNETRRTIGAPGVINAAAMNTITEGMFRNSSPNNIFSDPNIHAILDEEGSRGGDYLLNRLRGLTDVNMLQRIRMNVKNPESMRVLNNLITWQSTPAAMRPPGAATMRAVLLA